MHIDVSCWLLQNVYPAWNERFKGAAPSFQPAAAEAAIFFATKEDL